MSTSATSQEARFIADALAAEADAVQRLATRVAAGGAEATAFMKALDLLERCEGSLVVSGMGKSGLVGAKISATFASLGQPSIFVHPTEAVHGDLGRIRRGDMALLMSYSGETEEVLALASLLKADGVHRVAICKSERSSLGQACDACLPLGDIEEACPLNLAPTASTTAMLAVGDALALALARRRDFKADDFHRMHPGGMLGAGLRPVLEAVRFRVGRNLPCVQASGTLAEALREAGDGRRAGALMVVDAGCTAERLHDQASAHAACRCARARRRAHGARAARGRAARGGCRGQAAWPARRAGSGGDEGRAGLTHADLRARTRR
jgi:arabinose-5-phosphate isomerase